jgi:hypothetical protein
MGNLSVLPMDVLLFVAFVSFCLFFKKRELGLIGTFVFVCYLSFIFAKRPFISLGGNASSWIYVFGLASLGLTCLFLIGFSKKQADQSVSKTETPTKS